MPRDYYELQVQHTAGAYKTTQVFYRLDDALDAIRAVAAMNPNYPYEGGLTYAVGSSVHHKDRYRILKNGVFDKKILKEVPLTGLRKDVNI